jgi:hypothetical protein
MRGVTFSLVGIAVVALGCTSRVPLDLPLTQAGEINGQISVTVMTGISPTSGVQVEVLAPDGSQKKLITPSTNPGWGIAVFQESLEGKYKILVADQASTSPHFQTVNLSVGQPYATAILQMNGAALSLSPSDGLAQSFAGAAGVHAYTLSYQNPSAQNWDLVIVPTNVPAGWTVSIPAAQLMAGQSTALYVYNPAMTAVSPCAITLVGYTGSVAVASTSVQLAKNWALGLKLGTLQSYRGINDECASNAAYRVTSEINGDVSSFNVDPATLAATSFSGLYTVQSVSFQGACSTQSIVLPASSGLGAPLTLGTMRDGGGDSFTVSGTFTLYANGNLMVFDRPFTATSFGPNYSWAYQTFF